MKSKKNKLNHFASVLTVAGLTLSATSLLADNPNSSVSSAMIVPPPTLRTGAFFAVDVGLNVLDSLANAHGSISLDAGVRCDVSLGYSVKIIDRLTVVPAVELGIIYNSLSTASSLGVSRSISGSFYQVPVMGDLILNWEFFPHFVFYGGGGAGVEYNKLNITGVHGVNTDITNGEADFAWQAMVGIRYCIGASEISVGYKYLAIQPSGLNTIGNNAIMAAFAVHF